MMRHAIVAAPATNRARRPQLIALPEKARKIGPAMLASYTTVSALWYFVGIALALQPAPIPGAAATGLKRAMLRVGRAWVVTFAASQLSVAWRAAAAATLSPFIDAQLARLRDGLGLRGERARALVPAALYLLGVVSAFVAALCGLLCRELVRGRLTISV